MAHSAVHFSTGIILGTAIHIPRLISRWRKGEPLSRSFQNWLIVSYGIAAWAVLPGLLRRISVPDYLCDGWWMNVFLFYPLLNRLKSGGTIPGQIALILCFLLQYGLLLAAIRRASRTPTSLD